MNKKLFIAIGTAIIIIGIAVIIALTRKPYRAEMSNGSQGTGGSTVTNPPAQGDGNNLGMTFSVRTASGGTLRVKDFKQDPDTVKDPINAGYYYLGYHFTDDSTKKVPYVIEYIDATQYFNIVLFQEPIGQSRRAAERYLMEHLGITQNQMCQLQYMVSVPHFVNVSYTSMSLGFSFCPGSVVIPE